LLFTLPFKDAEERGATGMNGQGWPFKGRTGQEDPSNCYHIATKDEGSPKGHLTGERYRDVPISMLHRSASSD